MSLEKALDHIENGTVLDKIKPKTRLFSALDLVLTLSQKKVKSKKVPTNERMAWSRILISCVKAYGELYALETSEDIEKRLDEIEEVMFKNEQVH